MERSIMFIGCTELYVACLNETHKTKKQPSTLHRSTCFVSETTEAISTKLITVFIIKVSEE